MKTFLLILAMAVFRFGLSAEETNSIALPKTNRLVLLKISATDATKYYNKEMIVTGKVAQVTIRPTVTFLNLDKSYPNSPFAIVIFPRQVELFDDLNALRGKSIEIRGQIQKYSGKPQIVLDDTNQLTILDFTNSVTKAKRKVKAPAIPAPDNAPPVGPSTNAFPEIM
jgi:hypothetical protein